VRVSGCGNLAPRVRVASHRRPSADSRCSRRRARDVTQCHRAPRPPATGQRRQGRAGPPRGARRRARTENRAGGAASCVHPPTNPQRSSRTNALAAIARLRQGRLGGPRPGACCRLQTSRVGAPLASPPRGSPSRRPAPRTAARTGAGAATDRRSPQAAIATRVRGRGRTGSARCTAGPGPSPRRRRIRARSAPRSLARPVASPRRPPGAIRRCYSPRPRRARGRAGGAITKVCALCSGSHLPWTHDGAVRRNEIAQQPAGRRCALPFALRSPPPDFRTPRARRT